MSLLIPLIITGLAGPVSVVESPSNEIKVVAEELNKSLPKKIDDRTVLLGIEQQEQMLIYHVEVTGDLLDGVDLKRFHDETKNTLEKRMCKDKSLQYFVENNINIEFKYTGSNGMPLSSIPIDLRSCS